jgi:hypothetical protein
MYSFFCERDATFFFKEMSFLAELQTSGFFLTISYIICTKYFVDLERLLLGRLYEVTDIVEWTRR